MSHQRNESLHYGCIMSYTSVFWTLRILYDSLQAGLLSNRLFYLSIPPNIFVDVVKCASVKASSAKGWTRVIVEKPFGRDSESSGELTRCLKKYLTEDQIFRYTLLHCFLIRQTYGAGKVFTSGILPSGLIITWARRLLRTYQCFVSRILFLSHFGQGITSEMCN